MTSLSKLDQGASVNKKEQRKTREGEGPQKFKRENPLPPRRAKSNSDPPKRRAGFAESLQSKGREEEPYRCSSRRKRRKDDPLL